MTKEELRTVITLIDLCTQHKQQGYYATVIPFMDERDIAKLKSALQKTFRGEDDRNEP